MEEKILSKIAIVTDSNSGMTQAQGEQLGVHVLPMPFMINEEIYFEDINLSIQEFFDHLENNAEIGTSQPTPDSVLTLWKNLLNSYDEVVHIPMSSGLSGTCETAIMLSRDFNEKVQVVNNKRISVTQKQSVMDALALKIQGKNAKEIKTILEEDKYNARIYIMLDTLYYLKKGGRITPAAAALGTILKLKPVLQIQGDKLDAFAKARTISQAKNLMIQAMKNDIASSFNNDVSNVNVFIVHTQNEEAATEFKNELLEHFPNIEVAIEPLSLSISCHIGPGALALACTKKM